MTTQQHANSSDNYKTTDFCPKCGQLLKNCGVTFPCSETIWEELQTRIAAQNATDLAHREEEALRSYYAPDAIPSERKSNS